MSILEQLNGWWNDPDSLFGIPESQELEFKKNLYGLESATQRLEFAKDVSAMANGGGGLVVIGVESARDPGLGIDVSSAVPAVRSDAVDIERMQSIARAWVYPQMRDLRIRKWTSPDEMALVSIEVPAADGNQHPFIIRGAEIPSGRVRKTYFSVAIRHGDRVDWLLPDEIHRRLVAGGTEERDGGTTVESHDPGASPAAQLDTVRSLFADGDWPVLVLQGWPEQPVRLEDIHDDQGIRGDLIMETGLRRGGFNFDWYQSGADLPRLHGAGGIGWTVGDREGLWVLPDGTTTFYGNAGPDLLAWGMDQYHNAAGSVNPTVLAELAYEFVRLYKTVIEERTDSHRSAYRIAVMGEGTVAMSDGHRPVGAHTLHAIDLDEGEAVEKVGPFPREDTAEQITGVLLARFYGRFGLGRRACPYINPDTGDFDPETFIRLNGPGLGTR